MGIFGVWFSPGFRKKTRGCFNCFLIRSIKIWQIGKLAKSVVFAKVFELFFCRDRIVEFKFKFKFKKFRKWHTKAKPKAYLTRLTWYLVLVLLNCCFEAVVFVSPWWIKLLKCINRSYIRPSFLLFIS